MYRFPEGHWLETTTILPQTKEHHKGVLASQPRSRRPSELCKHQHLDRYDSDIGKLRSVLSWQDSFQTFSMNPTGFAGQGAVKSETYRFPSRKRKQQQKVQKQHLYSANP